MIIDNDDEYLLEKFRGLNERTCQNHRPIVKLGQKVEAGQIIADGASTEGAARHRQERDCRLQHLRRLQLRGRHRHQRAAREGRRLHLDPHRPSRWRSARPSSAARSSRPTSRTSPRRQLANLDDVGIVRDRHGSRPWRHPRRQGQPQEQVRVDAGREAAPCDLRSRRRGREERLARGARRHRAASSSAPAHFSRRMHLNDEQKKPSSRTDIHLRGADERPHDRTVQARWSRRINETTGTEMVDPSTRQKVGASDIAEVILEQIENFNDKWIKGSKESREARQAEKRHVLATNRSGSRPRRTIVSPT